MHLIELRQLLQRSVPAPYVHLFADLSKNTAATEIEILFYLLVYERERGNLALNLTEPVLTHTLENFLQQNSETLPQNLTEITRQLSMVDFSSCNFTIIPQEAEQVSYKPLVLFRNYLYFQREFMSVCAVAKKIAQLRQGKSDFSLHETYSIYEIISSAMGYRLNPEQKLAFAHAINSMFTIITGGPGTGKSSLVRYLINYFVNFAPAEQKIEPHNIKLCAPTGKAAHRMQESLGTWGQQVFCGTIHRMLEYRSGKYRYHERNPLPAALVVVDEVSMIDIALMNGLLSALPNGCRLIFLGDRNQLPPVGSGAMLSELVPDFQACRYDAKLVSEIQKISEDVQQPQGEKIVRDVIFLTRNMRESDKSRILENSISGIAVAVLENKEPELRRFLQQFTATELNNVPSGCSRLATLGNLTATLTAFCRELYQKTRDINPLDIENIRRLLSERKILTFLREGMSGAIYLNRQINRSLTGKNELLFAGQHIMVTTNDALTQLNNGDTGIILDLPGEGLRAGFVKNDSIRWFKPAELPPWETAWCITVHKSQGSEYDEVLLLLPGDAKHRMLYRELLYTGITRARNKAILTGSDEVILAAAQRQFMRENGYPFWEINP